MRSATQPVTRPVRPNSTMMATPTTKGGVMIGRIEMARSARLMRKSVRFTRSASARPSAVASVADRTPSTTVLTTTPQRPAPVKQPIPQRSGAESRAQKVPSARRAVGVDEGRDAELEDREEDEERQQRDDGGDAEGREAFAPAEAACRDEVGQQARPARGPARKPPQPRPVCPSAAARAKAAPTQSADGPRRPTAKPCQIEQRQRADRQRRAPGSTAASRA